MARSRLVLIGSLLADDTWAEILISLMDGRCRYGAACSPPSRRRQRR